MEEIQVTERQWRPRGGPVPPELLEGGGHRPPLYGNS